VLVTGRAVVAELSAGVAAVGALIAGRAAVAAFSAGAVPGRLVASGVGSAGIIGGVSPACGSPESSAAVLLVVGTPGMLSSSVLESRRRATPANKVVVRQAA
jgi:hypothetical protein